MSAISLIMKLDLEEKDYGVLEQIKLLMNECDDIDHKKQGNEEENNEQNIINENNDINIIYDRIDNSHYFWNRYENFHFSLNKYLFYELVHLLKLHYYYLGIYYFYW